MQPGTPAERDSANFGFLREHDPLLLRLCVAAEAYATVDPNAAIVKLRQFGEALARHLAAVFSIASSAAANQDDLLAQLQRQGCLDRDVATLLHTLRKAGTPRPHRAQATL